MGGRLPAHPRSLQSTLIRIEKQTNKQKEQKNTIPQSPPRARKLPSVRTQRLVPRGYPQAWAQLSFSAYVFLLLLLWVTKTSLLLLFGKKKVSGRESSGCCVLKAYLESK
jgi:hypothetical protein